MYLHSRIERNMKKPERVTRAIMKLVFKTPSRCINKYLNSPFYKGTVPLNNLDNDLQRMCNVKGFVNGLDRLYTEYQEIW